MKEIQFPELSNLSLAGNKDDIENSLWKALEMDDLYEEMTKGTAMSGKSLLMGTGRTHNACYGCGNSNTTAGCGGC